MHRTAKINQESFRYSEVRDEFQETLPNEWRTQSKQNKQQSGADNVCENKGYDLCLNESFILNEAYNTYQERIDAGVAREQARKDIPVSTYTNLYWQMDLRNLLHFLGLRLDYHAQKEIRELANIIAYYVSELFPISWKAWEQNVWNSVKFTQTELNIILDGKVDEAQDLLGNKRLYKEFIEKLKTKTPIEFSQLKQL